MRVERFSINNSGLFEQAFKIRERVFIGELHIDPEMEFEHEDVSVHYLFFDYEDKAIATARYRETPEGYKIERLAVIKSHRNKGLGGIVLKCLLEDLIPLQKTIYLNSQIEAVDFYLRNNFETDGPSFEEAGVTHHKMIYKKT